VQELRFPATDLSDEWVTPIGAADASDLRVLVNRMIYRGMLFSMGTIAVGLHQISPSLAWSFAKMSARNLALATGVEVKLVGAENVPAEPSIITPNHASHFDIAALLGYLPGHNRFAAKKELFREPVLGTVMRTLGMIPIDREDPAQSVATLNKMATRGEEAFSLIMFPEGTRSRDGHMGAFKNGAFTLALQLGRPIVPIAIHGTSSIMPAGQYLSILPGTVVLEVLEPIPTVGRSVDDRIELRDLVRERIADRLAAVRDAAS
jgi:1-acyl-sn-glycerol-3-phosphate acyltransferase